MQTRKARPAVAEPESAAGAALRAARLDKGLSLEQLGRATELSPAFLSRLERAHTSTSISNLLRLCAALDLAPERLFPAAPLAPAGSGYALLRTGGASPLTAGVYRYRAVAGGLPHHAVAVFELEYPPGAGEELGWYRHEGEEVLYMLEGRIEFRIGADRIRLAPGDSLQFDASQPHRGRNVGDGTARMLMIVAGARGGAAVVPSFARGGRLEKPGRAVPPSRTTRRKEKRS